MSGHHIRSEFNHLEQMLQTLNSLPNLLNDEDEAVNFVVDVCRKNKELLEQKCNDAELILGNANPAYCSPIFVACIKAVWDVASAKKQDQGLEKAVDLLKTLLENGYCLRNHIRLIPDLYLPLARDCVFHCLTKKANPFLAFDIGKTAINVFMEEGDNFLTSLHAAVLAAAIKIGNFQEANKFVYVPIHNIISELNPALDNVDVISKRSRCTAPSYFDSKYILSYFFYCGLIVAKLGNYKQSIQFMEMCIGVPGSVASQIQVDALKKYYVLSLILNGDVTIPVNRCPTLMRVLKAKGRLDAYQSLTVAVTDKGNKVQAVEKVLESKKSHFEQDNNWGLCQILIKSLRKKAVLNVVKSYSSINVNVLAHRSYCSKDSVVSFLQELQNQGEITAIFDGETVRLSVNEKPITHQDIESRKEFIAYMQKVVERLDTLSQLNPSHIIRTLRGAAAHLALLDDEGLSETTCPMDA